MSKNIALRNTIIITFICVFYSVSCFGQVSITYQAPKPFIAGTAITPLIPDIKGFKTATFSISPTLPDSLSIDKNTGKISGKPVKPSIEVEYTVTAKYTTVATKDTSINSMPIKITVTDIKDASATTKPTCCKVNDGDDLGLGEWVLVFLPIVLVIGVFILVLQTINLNTTGTDKFILKNALSESGYSTITKANPQLATQAQSLINLQQINTGATLPILASFPPTINETDNRYRPSISRLIAFLTSIITLITGLCISSFFIYSYLRNGCEPDISKLSAVFISLGIGVAPYAVNKVTGIFGGGQNSGTAQPTPGKTGG